MSAVPIKPPLTKRAIREEMKDFLGEGIVSVELQDRHIVKAIRDATRQFNAFRPLRSWTAIRNAQPSVKRYNLSQINPNIAGITYVGFVDQWQIGSPNSLVDPAQYQFQRVMNMLGGETYGQITADLTYIRMSREVTSAEPEWRGQWDATQDGTPPTYHLYLDLRRPMDVAVEYSWYLTEMPAPDAEEGDDPTASDFAYGLRNVPQGDVSWFMNFITARCKQTLGRALRKHGGTPSSGGGTDPTDGADLVAEGRLDEERLVDEIKRRRRPLPPVPG